MGKRTDGHAVTKKKRVPTYVHGRRTGEHFTKFAAHNQIGLLVLPSPIILLGLRRDKPNWIVKGLFANRMETGIFSRCSKTALSGSINVVRVVIGPQDLEAQQFSTS